MRGSIALLLVLTSSLAWSQEGLGPPPGLLSPSARRSLDAGLGSVEQRLPLIRQGLESPSVLDHTAAARALERVIVERYGQSERLAPVSPELLDALATALARAHGESLEPVHRSLQLLLANCQATTDASLEACATRLGLTRSLEQFGGPQAVAPALELLPVNRGPGLDQHMANAIGINWGRMGRYADLAANTTAGWDAVVARKDSYLVSLYMLTSEQSTRGMLLWLDWQASDLNQAGVPILAEDVIPLRPRAVDTPPTYRGRASDWTVADAEARLAAFRAAGTSALAGHDFDALAASARETLRDLIALERRERCHFAMTRHMVASVGYGALRASQHVAATAGAQREEVRALAASYLRSNLMALVHGFALRLDRWAQDVHARGVGIVVNEFPGGHFIRAYDGD